MSDSTLGTTRTIIEPPLVLRNSLPIPLRICLRQFFPTSAVQKETELPHTLLAGTEEEVYDVNTLAHAYVVLSFPSMRLGVVCCTDRNAIHMKSMWCDGAATSPTRQPRNKDLEVPVKNSDTKEHVMKKRHQTAQRKATVMKKNIKLHKGKKCQFHEQKGIMNERESKFEFKFELATPKVHLDLGAKQ